MGVEIPSVISNNLDIVPNYGFYNTTAAVDERYHIVGIDSGVVVAIDEYSRVGDFDVRVDIEDFIGNFLLETAHYGD